MRLPASILEAKGAFDHDPQRRRVDAVGVGELGNAPSYFTEDQKKIWKELKGQLPPGLCKSADRMMAEVTVRLIHKFRTEGLKAGELTQLINALGRLGCSPADRTKCAMPETKTDSKNEFGEFLQNA